MLPSRNCTQVTYVPARAIADEQILYHTLRRIILAGDGAALARFMAALRRNAEAEAVSWNALRTALLTAPDASSILRDAFQRLSWNALSEFLAALDPDLRLYLTVLDKAWQDELSPLGLAIKEGHYALAQHILTYLDSDLTTLAQRTTSFKPSQLGQLRYALLTWEVDDQSYALLGQFLGECQPTLRSQFLRWDEPERRHTCAGYTLLQLAAQWHPHLANALRGAMWHPTRLSDTEWVAALQARSWDTYCVLSQDDEQMHVSTNHRFGRSSLELAVLHQPMHIDRLLADVATPMQRHAISAHGGPDKFARPLLSFAYMHKRSDAAAQLLHLLQTLSDNEKYALAVDSVPDCPSPIEAAIRWATDPALLIFLPPAIRARVLLENSHNGTVLHHALVYRPNRFLRLFNTLTPVQQVSFLCNTDSRIRNVPILWDALRLTQYEEYRAVTDCILAVLQDLGQVDGANLVRLLRQRGVAAVDFAISIAKEPVTGPRKRETLVKDAHLQPLAAILRIVPPPLHVSLFIPGEELHSPLERAIRQSPEAFQLIVAALSTDKFVELVCSHQNSPLYGIYGNLRSLQILAKKLLVLDDETFGRLVNGVSGWRDHLLLALHYGMLPHLIEVLRRHTPPVLELAKIIDRPDALEQVLALLPPEETLRAMFCRIDSPIGNTPWEAICRIEMESELLDTAEVRLWRTIWPRARTDNLAAALRLCVQQVFISASQSDTELPMRLQALANIPWGFLCLNKTNVNALLNAPADGSRMEPLSDLVGWLFFHAVARDQTLGTNASSKVNDLTAAVEDYPLLHALSLCKFIQLWYDNLNPNQHNHYDFLKLRAVQTLDNLRNYGHVPNFPQRCIALLRENIKTTILSPVPVSIQTGKETALGKSHK